MPTLTWKDYRLPMEDIAPWDTTVLFVSKGTPLVAAVQRHHLDPADVGVAQVGHFGAFRRDPGVALWRRLLGPVEAAAPALARAGFTAL